MANRGLNHSLQSLKIDIAKINQSGIDKYNPHNSRLMEEYVDAQAMENDYDLEANLLLLKLYQLNPVGYSGPRASFVTKILLKALMQLPRNDFQICKALMEPELMRVIKIQDVMRLATTLETCQFEFFWEELPKCRDTLSGVEGFDVAIQNYICSVVERSNQSIYERQLNAYLGKLPYERFKRLVEERGWKFAGNGLIFIRDQTSNVRTRKIAETIDFADVATILSAAARS